MVTSINFKTIRDYIHNHTGIYFKESKTYFLEQKLKPVLDAYQITNFSDLCDRLQMPNRRLSHSIIEAVTINETSFFRDKSPFEILSNTLLPEINKHLIDKSLFKYDIIPDKIKIWSAAASTGQEAYSIAMSIHDYIHSGRANGLSKDNFSIFCTDISTDVLKIAEQGIYENLDIRRGLSNFQLNKHFSKAKNGWQANQYLRDMMKFQQCNLINFTAGIGKFDIIFCRNVLIYFDQETKARIVAKLSNCLNEGGHLILGAGENIAGNADKFRPRKIQNLIIYQKIDKNDMVSRKV